MLRVTAACTFSTSQLQKCSEPVHILTSECASRRATAQRPKVLYPRGVFYLQTRRAPQSRTLFEHLNFQSWLAAAACSAFSCIFTTYTCFAQQRRAIFDLSSGHMAPNQSFSELFRPSGATKHWHNTAFWDFSIFSRILIFFLLTLSLL